MRNIKKFGLIGRDIDYSFSRNYFNEKFKINSEFKYFEYVNFDIQSINEIENIFRNNLLSGLNVTIPYKESVIRFLDTISVEASEIGAVNTICFKNEKKIGFNTDIYGFTKALELNNINNIDLVLILGSGGAAKTVSYYCRKNKIDYKIVSRKNSKEYISYSDINQDLFVKNLLIVNCTPIGTFPNINKHPKLPYKYLSSNHILFDLVYNPTQTLFLKKGAEKGCITINGYEMLKFQAEMSWDLWTKQIE